MTRITSEGACEVNLPASQAAQLFTIARSALNSSPAVIIGAKLPTYIGTIEADGPGPWTLVLRLDLTDTDVRVPNPLYRGNSLATAELPNLVKGSLVTRGSPSLRFGVSLWPGGDKNIPQPRVLDLSAGSGPWMGTVSAQRIDLHCIDLLGGESTAAVPWTTGVLSACLTPTYEAGARPPRWTCTDWLRVESGPFQISPVFTVPPPGAVQFSVMGQMQPLAGVWPTMQLQGVIGGGSTVLMGETTNGEFLSFQAPRTWPAGCQQLGLVNQAGAVNPATEPWGNIISIAWEAN